MTSVSAGVMLIETVKAIGPFVHHHFSASQRVVGVPGAVLTKTDLNIEEVLAILESEAGQKIPQDKLQAFVKHWHECVLDSCCTCLLFNTIIQLDHRARRARAVHLTA